MAEANTYTGTISSIRDTYQKLTSVDAFSKQVQWACFTKTPAMRAFGLEGFGVQSMKDFQNFAGAKPTGRVIRYDSGVYGLRGSINATAPTSSHVGRMGNFQGQLVEGGDEWAYSWHRLIQVEYIPDVDVQDNTKGNINIKLQKQDGMKQQYVQDFNYCLLGNSSAPDAGSMGVSAVYTDLPNLISYSQTRTVGAIAKTNSYWQNGVKAIASIGGGGEMDRPIQLVRSMVDGKNDQMKYAEASDDYLWMVTQGFYQSYGHLMYADMVQSGRPGAFGTIQRYDAAGIKHYAFDGGPMVWDPAVTLPYDAGSTVTAGTECATGIHLPTFFVGLRTEENFKLSEWEPPREHDVQKTLVCSLKTRYTLGVTAMRPHVVFYNIPANTD